MRNEQYAQPFCSCCGTAVAYDDDRSPHSINISATIHALIERVADGRMTIIKGDCPLEGMLDLLTSDTKYTIVEFLHCRACGNIIFWGLCIRGTPIYKVSDEKSVRNWPWE